MTAPSKEALRAAWSLIIYCDLCIENGNCDRAGPHCSNCVDVNTHSVVDLAGALDAFAAQRVAACEKKWSGHYADLLISVSSGKESDNRAALLIEFLEQCHRDGVDCATAANVVRARGKP